MDSNDIFDKSIWPLFTPGLHWALSDPIKYIGRLSKVDDDSVEYTINSKNLPDGDEGLWHVNALRDITFNLTDMPSEVQDAIESVTLCLGPKALQSIKVESTSSDILFSMFSNGSILPLFVVDDDRLSISVQFKTSLDNMRSRISAKAIHATGLLVKIKERQKSFFVAGSKDSVLTWDGHQSHVYSKACEPRSFMGFDDMPDLLKEARDEIVLNDESTHIDLWNVLKLRKGTWASECSLSDGLETPR